MALASDLFDASLEVIESIDPIVACEVSTMEGIETLICQGASGAVFTIYPSQNLSTIRQTPDLNFGDPRPRQRPRPSAG